MSSVFSGILFICNLNLFNMSTTFIPSVPPTSQPSGTTSGHTEAVSKVTTAPVAMTTQSFGQAGSQVPQTGFASGTGKPPAVSLSSTVKKEDTTGIHCLFLKMENTSLALVS